MCYRGGGICHKYMREVEDWFDDMKRNQVTLEEAPQAAQSPQDGDNSAGEPLAGVAKTTDSGGNASMADGESENDSEGGIFEEEIPGDERPETHLMEDNYLSGEDSEEDSDDDGTGEGAYGMLNTRIHLPIVLSSTSPSNMVGPQLYM